VNDSEYGGSGGFPAIASIHSSSSELALHEIAHSFADLADEYDSAAPGYPEIEKANTTRETRRDFYQVAQLDQRFPLPSPRPKRRPTAMSSACSKARTFTKTTGTCPKLNCRMNTTRSGLL
jgi:hypothetical protein